MLVTGATGFLGGAIVRRLRALGCDVIASGRDNAKLGALQATGIETMALDLARPDDGHPARACDAVVHCAALSSPWGDRADFYRANVVGTQTALALATNGGARRFVHISTPSVYFRFQDQIDVREDAELPPPVNAYAETKRRAEELVLAKPKLDPIILRPRGLYGPGDTTLLPRLIAAARSGALPLMNDGRAAIDLTYVDDVADAACAALAATPPQDKRVFNVSGGKALNVRDVSERAAESAGVKIKWRRMPSAFVLAYARASETICTLLPRRPEPAITAYSAALFAFTQTLNIDAAKVHLGWAPRVGFDEGLARTFDGAPA